MEYPIENKRTTFEIYNSVYYCFNERRGEIYSQKINGGSKLDKVPQFIWKSSVGLKGSQDCGMVQDA